jgi:hypothetical protein
LRGAILAFYEGQKDTRKVYGKVELERLIVDVVRTLRDAQMHQALCAFDERVLSREPEHLFDTPEDGSEPSFKPMVELLLRELMALGTATDSRLDRLETRALEAIHLAGF